MRNWSRALLAIAVFVSALLAPSAARAADDATVPEYLFVFDGRGGEMKPVPGTPGTFDFTMPLRVGDHVVTWFTDRPVRNAGHMSMKSFVDLWKPGGGDTFEANPPNVAISSGRRNLIATMSKASIGKAKGGGEELRATMTLVPGEVLTALAQGDSYLGARATRAGANAHRGTWRMPNVSVFVDQNRALPHSYQM